MTRSTTIWFWLKVLADGTVERRAEWTRVSDLSRPDAKPTWNHWASEITRASM